MGSRLRYSHAARPAQPEDRARGTVPAYAGAQRNPQRFIASV